MRRPRGLWPATDEEIAAIGLALAHPARVRLLRALKACGAAGQAALAAEVGLSQSAASKHLGALVRAGLIAAERRGGAVTYRIARANLARLRMLLVSYTSS